MPASDSRIAVYTGSFDPITLGHINVIERSSCLFDRLIVGIGINIDKPSLFSPEERAELVYRSASHLSNVEVRTFTGLAVKFVRECGAGLMIRGVRTLSDMEAEFTMMLANRKLDPGLETVLLMADDQFSHISSSLIKQIATSGGEEELGRFVPQPVVQSLLKKLGGAESRSIQPASDS